MMILEPFQSWPLYFPVKDAATAVGAPAVARRCVRVTWVRTAEPRLF
jgi:hypothetical protein